VPVGWAGLMLIGANGKTNQQFEGQILGEAVSRAFARCVQWVCDLLEKMSTASAGYVSCEIAMA